MKYIVVCKMATYDSGDAGDPPEERVSLRADGGRAEPELTEHSHDHLLDSG